MAPNPLLPVGPGGSYRVNDPDGPSVPDNLGSLAFPTSKQVINLHRNADVDLSARALHHTLGSGANQASPGNHLHDGESGEFLFPTGTGSTSEFKENLGLYAGGANGGLKETVKQLLTVLIALGVTDSTTNAFEQIVNATQNIGTDQGQKDLLKILLTALAPMGIKDSTTMSGNWNDVRIGSINGTFGTAGTNGDTVVVTFSPAMAGAPRIALTPRTSATVLIVPYIIAAGTTTGFSFKLVASASQSAGTNIPVEYIAVAPVAYT